MLFAMLRLCSHMLVFVVVFVVLCFFNVYIVCVWLCCRCFVWLFLHLGCVVCLSVSTYIYVGVRVLLLSNQLCICLRADVLMCL